MVLAQWQHCAILELTRLDSFRPDVRWIGRVLGLSTDDVNVAVTRLLHLGLLSMSAADVWRDESGDAELTSTEFSHTVLQLLADRLRSLEAAELDGARSFFSATTLAVQASRLPAVVEYLQSVRNQLAELAAEHGHSGDDVYRFDVALFPLTNMNQTRKEPDGSTSKTVSDHREEPGPGC